MEKHKNLGDRINIKNVVLNTIETVGIISAALLAPGVLKAIGKIKKQQRHYQQKYYVNKVIKEMVESRLIEYHNNSQGIKCLRLTDRGKDKLRVYAIDDFSIKKPWRWDKKYRVIIFDIKEYKRRTRDKLRRWLEHLGFVRLQNSVWVYPYECREVIVLLKSYFKIGKEVLYMTVDSIENDKWLKEEFNLNLD